MKYTHSLFLLFYKCEACKWSIGDNKRITAKTFFFIAWHFRCVCAMYDLKEVEDMKPNARLFDFSIQKEWWQSMAWGKENG